MGLRRAERAEGDDGVARRAAFPLLLTSLTAPTAPTQITAISHHTHPPFSSLSFGSSPSLVSSRNPLLLDVVLLPPILPHPSAYYDEYDDDEGYHQGHEKHGEHEGHEGHEKHEEHEKHEGHGGHEKHEGHKGHEKHEGHVRHEGHEKHEGHEVVGMGGGEGADGRGEEDEGEEDLDPMMRAMNAARLAVQAYNPTTAAQGGTDSPE